MAKFEMDTDFIRKLAAILEETGLGEIELADGDRSIRVAGGHRDGPKAFLISVTSPGSLQPGRFQVPGTMATTLNLRPSEIG